MTKIALFGAGGKMGRRLTAALKDCDYDMSYIEIGEEGIRVLEELGVSVTKQEDILPDADAVILALPDVLVGKISHEIIPQLRSGSMVMMLDVAAMLAGAIHIRDDVSYFFFHPCHHNILKRERKGEHIVCALMQGSDDDYRLGEKIAKDIYEPVIQANRMTVMQMGLLEPALAETVGIACCSFLRDAVDEVDDKAVDYLPSLDDEYPQYADITFRHLASMTSGYSTVERDSWNLYLQGRYDEHYQCVLTYTNPGLTLFHPGTAFGYHDPAIHMLGYILTKVSGRMSSPQLLKIEASSDNVKSSRSSKFIGPWYSTVSKQASSLHQLIVPLPGIWCLSLMPSLS